MFSNTDLPALRPTADAGGIDLSGTWLTWQNRAELRCLSPVQILQEKLFEQPGAHSGVYSESTALTRASQLRERLVVIERRSGTILGHANAHPDPLPATVL